MEKIVEIEKLSFTYGNVSIFKDLDLTIESGSFCTILGSSGSGKSTLARILYRLEPVSGYVKLFNLFSNRKNALEICRRIGFISEQSLHQFVADTVFKEISFSFIEYQNKIDNVDEKVREIASQLEIENLLFRNPKTLSAGEKQLVILASTLVREPELLILDDAFSMIDNYKKKNIFLLIQKWCREKKLTVLHFTHCVEDVLMGTELLILSQGKIISHKKVVEALQSEKEFSSNHLELPFLSNLANKLLYYNAISENYIDENKLVNALWK